MKGLRILGIGALLLPLLAWSQETGAMDTTAAMTADTAVAVETMTADTTTVDTSMGYNAQEVEQTQQELAETMEVESSAGGMVGFTVGLNVGYPVWFSQGLANEEKAPIFAVLIGTPYGFQVGPLNIGVGAEIGGYSFGDEAKGLAILGTINTMLANTGAGPIAAQIGAGYYGKSVGGTAGVSFDYQVPNLPLLVRAYVRANATLNSGKDLGDNDSVGWINVGTMLSFDISQLMGK